MRGTAGPRWPWWALGLLWAVVAIGLPLAPTQAPVGSWPAPLPQLTLLPGLGLNQPFWVWWSSACVHGSPAHLHHNLLALGALLLIGHRGDAGPRAAFAACLAWPLTQGGMLAQPELTHFIGLSGLLHALAVVLGLHLWQQNATCGIPRVRVLVTLCALGLGAKLLMENPWQFQALWSQSSAINVTPWVHFWGALMGALGWWASGLVPWHGPHHPDSTD